MSRTEIALLGYALLGLLQQQPASGYDLRKIFAETAMGNFSDSPGAIYPALRRLEEHRLIESTLEAGRGMLRRRVFALTASGQAELTAWLTRPVSQEDVAKRLNELMLRFAFMDGAAGRVATLRFLRAYREQLMAYVPSLKGALEKLAAKMPLSGRLAFESGILGYEAQLEWASRAISMYSAGEESQ